MRTAMYEWSRDTSTHCACAVRIPLRGMGLEGKGQWTRREGPWSRGPAKKKNGSAAADRCPSPRFLPHSASWLPHTAATAPTAGLPTGAAHRKRYLQRLRPPRKTNRSSASAPPFPAASAPPPSQSMGEAPLRPRPARPV